MVIFVAKHCWTSLWMAFENNDYKNNVNWGAQEAISNVYEQPKAFYKSLNKISKHEK